MKVSPVKNMPFNAAERFELSEILKRFGSLKPTYTEKELEFFKEKELMRQLRTYLIISPPKAKRIVESATLIFLIDENFVLSEIIEELFQFISPSFRILIDFSFLLENVNVEDESARFRFAWDQRSTSLPLETNLIKDEESMEMFLSELPPLSEIPDLVSRSHQNQSQFNSSGYQLRKLLTCAIYLTKLQ